MLEPFAGINNFTETAAANGSVAGGGGCELPTSH